MIPVVPQFIFDRAVRREEVRVSRTEPLPTIAAALDSSGRPPSPIVEPFTPNTVFPQDDVRHWLREDELALWRAVECRDLLVTLEIKVKVVGKINDEAEQKERASAASQLLRSRLLATRGSTVVRLLHQIGLLRAQVTLSSPVG